MPFLIGHGDEEIILADSGIGDDDIDRVEIL
jgi:hypothetical protein